jgi:hypothetical protein
MHNLRIPAIYHRSMEGSNERGHSEKGPGTNEAASEHRWASINRDALHRAISDRIDRGLQDQTISGKITEEEADELRDVYSELLARVIDGVVTRTPDWFNHQLPQQEQDDAVREVMDQVTSLATKRMRQRRS